MKITLIAKTELQVDEVAYRQNNYERGFFTDVEMEIDPNALEAETLIEFAGRACYQSFHKPNEKTRRTADYIRRTALEQMHGSILEHASASFYVEGVSRNMLLELERHRHLSFSVISQRFVNSEDTPFVEPPAVTDLPLESKDAWEIQEQVDDAMSAAREAYGKIVDVLQMAGRTRKQAREAARAILPGGLETKFVVTGNLRAWRHVISLRSDPGADAEIQDFARSVLSILRTEVAPSVFADFPEEPFDE